MVALVNISESSLSAVMLLSLNVVYGVLVCGCRNASVISNAARVAVSADDKLGMLICFRRNFIVSHTHVTAVFVT